MKMDRLIGILSILLQQEKVTAPYLAEKFEVSRRTINRDIEDICMAGIPLVTAQGKNGGISIMEGYGMDKTLLTISDMQALLTGLRSLDSISDTNKYQQLMDKLSVGSSSSIATGSHIAIDLSSWYKTSLTPKIELLLHAIEETREVTFAYYAPTGESNRRIEPYLLIFQWASWYVWGYCLDKKDFRMFKLNRMLNIHCLDHIFDKRQIAEFQIGDRRGFQKNAERVNIEAVFEPETKWRLIDEMGVESFAEQQDGKLKFRFVFSDKTSALTWLLSFGSQVELLSPKELREDLLRFVNKVKDIYQ